MSEQEQEQGEVAFEAPEGVPETPPEGTEPEPEGDESDEEQEAAEAAPEEAAPEQPALSEKDVEKRLNSLEKEATRHANRVSEIMDADAQMLVPCPLCEAIIPGFVMQGQLDEARRQTVRIFLGDREPENWQPDRHRSRCETCDGYGEVLTGSRAHGQETLPCLDCSGKGWTGDESVPSYTPPVVAAPAPTTNGAPGAALSAEDMAKVEELRGKGVVAILPTAPVGP